MSPDDDDLRSSYAQLTRPTAPVEDPVSEVRRRMGRRRQRRRGVAALASVAVVTVVGLAIHGGTEAPSASSGAAGPTAAPSHGALPVPGAQSCAVEYNRQTLGQRAWAADATVTKVGRGRTTVTVELDVNRWYRGGTSQTLEVQLPSPRSQVEDAPPTYGVDTRLLLSGSGSDSTRQASTCGFTRYYDTKTAAVWATVFTR